MEALQALVSLMSMQIWLHRQKEDSDAYELVSPAGLDVSALNANLPVTLNIYISLDAGYSWTSDPVQITVEKSSSGGAADSDEEEDYFALFIIIGIAIVVIIIIVVVVLVCCYLRKHRSSESYQTLETGNEKVKQLEESTTPPNLLGASGSLPDYATM